MSVSTGTGLQQMGQSLQNVAGMLINKEIKEGDQRRKDQKEREKLIYQEAQEEEARSIGEEYQLQLAKYGKDMPYAKALLKANAWLSRTKANISEQRIIQGLVPQQGKTEKDYEQEKHDQMILQGKELLNHFKTFDPIGAADMLERAGDLGMKPGEYAWTDEGQKFYEKRMVYHRNLKTVQEKFKILKANNELNDETTTSVYQKHMVEDLDNVQYQVNGWVTQVKRGKMSFEDVIDKINNLEISYMNMENGNPKIYRELTGDYWSLVKQSVKDVQNAPANEALFVKGKADIILNTAKLLMAKDKGLLKVMMSSELYRKINDPRMLHYIKKSTGVSSDEISTSFSEMFMADAFSEQSTFDNHIGTFKTTYGDKTFNLDTIKDVNNAKKLISSLVTKNTHVGRAIKTTALAVYMKDVSNREEVISYLQQVVIGDPEVSQPKKDELVKALNFWRSE